VYFDYLRVFELMLWCSCFLEGISETPFYRLAFFWIAFLPVPPMGVVLFFDGFYCFDMVFLNLGGHH
jgi:hypothetical protein